MRLLSKVNMTQLRQRGGCKPAEMPLKLCGWNAMRWREHVEISTRNIHTENGFLDARLHLVLPLLWSNVKFYGQLVFYNSRLTLATLISKAVGRY